MFVVVYFFLSLGLNNVTTCEKKHEGGGGCGKGKWIPTLHKSSLCGKGKWIPTLHKSSLFNSEMTEKRCVYKIMNSPFLVIDLYVCNKIRFRTGCQVKQRDH